MRCDMAAFNHFYRNKLKQSMTYQIWNGYFKNVRAILDADPTGNEPLNVDETDEWWLDSEAYRNKNATKNLSKNSKLSMLMFLSFFEFLKIFNFSTIIFPPSTNYSTLSKP